MKDQIRILLAHQVRNGLMTQAKADTYLSKIDSVSVRTLSDVLSALQWFAFVKHPCD